MHLIQAVPRSKRTTHLSASRRRWPRSATVAGRQTPSERPRHAYAFLLCHFPCSPSGEPPAAANCNRSCWTDSSREAASSSMPSPGAALRPDASAEPAIMSDHVGSWGRPCNECQIMSDHEGGHARARQQMIHRCLRTATQCNDQQGSRRELDARASWAWHTHFYAAHLLRFQCQRPSRSGRQPHPAPGARTRTARTTRAAAPGRS